VVSVPRKDAPTRVMVMGLGDVGLRMARAVRARTTMDLVGVADPDEARRAAALSALGDSAAGPEARALAEATTPDVVIQATTSVCAAALKQAEALMDCCAAIVSTTETLAWPWFTEEAEALRLDAAAEEAGCVIIGAGVNPGWVLDALPVMAAAPCESVASVYCRRRVNTALRRRALQQKTALGLTKEEFDALIARGGGHAGLRESVCLIGAGLGIRFDKVTETIQPVVAEAPVQAGDTAVREGCCLGLRQRAVGWLGGDTPVVLDLAMAWGLEDPADRIEVDGVPKVSLTIEGGVAGEPGTSGRVVNIAAIASELSPGIRTVLDLPLRVPAYGIG